MRHARAARLAGLLGLLGGLACDGQDSAEHDMRAAETPEARPREAQDAELADRWRETPIFRSGSRLRARIATGGGGASAFGGFFDSELHVPCGFALADDGEYRCLPEVADGRIRFLDAECTQPIYEPFDVAQGGGCSSSVGTFITDWAGPDLTCSEAYRRRVMRVGKTLAPVMAYGLGSAGCTRQTVMPCPHEVESLPAEMFMRGRFEVEPADHGITIDWLEYDDGARVIGRLRDSERETNCGPMPAVFADRCIPTDQAHVFGDIFSSEGCTGASVALDFSREPCTTSAVVIAWEMDECQDYSPKAFELGSVLSNAFVSTKGGCEKHVSTPDQWFYAVGEPLAARELPPLRSARVGTARLGVRYYATADGRPLLYDDEPFYDTELDRPCHPEPFADGTQRCVPQWKQIGDIGQAGPFADAACTQRVVPMEVSDTGCRRAPEFVRVHSALPDLRLRDLYEVDAHLSDDDMTLFYLDGKACKPFPAEAGYDYYLAGKRLELAEIKQSIE
jgi:hypothetical protein